MASGGPTLADETTVTAISRDPVLQRWLVAALPDVAVEHAEPDVMSQGDFARRSALFVLDEQCLSDDDEPRLQQWLRTHRMLVLVRKHDPHRVAALLESGAEDVMCEPFLAAELRARARRVLLRGMRASLECGEVAYDMLRREVRRRDGSRRRLTASESIVMESLLEAHGDVVSKDALLSRLAEHPLQVESNVVERHVATLRAKLGDDHRRARVIATVPRRGYQLRNSAVLTQP